MSSKRVHNSSVDLFSEDETSSVEDDDDEVASLLSYQSLDEHYRQQLPSALESSDSGDDSSSLDDCEGLYLSSQQVSGNPNSTEIIGKDGNFVSDKVINILPKGFRLSAMSQLSNESISRDLFKTCCSHSCLRKISPAHESCNFEPCIQFMRERRKDLLGKSLPEQITLLKTYIYNSMHRKSQVHNSSRQGEYNQSSGRMNFEYVVDGHTFCGKGFCHVFGITYYLQKRLVKEIKEGRIGVSYSDIEGKKLSTIDSEAAVQILKLLNEHKIHVSNSTKTNLSLPDSDEIGYGRAWLQNHFKVAGDFDPTKLEEIHLDMIEIKDIYEEYLADMKHFFNLASRSILSYSRFSWLIRKAFSFVKIRDYRSNTGTCETCSAISAIRRSTQSAHQRTLATTLYGLHRSMYMGEKEAYYARCLEAMRDPEHTMSINTDGMDQFKTSIPRNLGDLPQCGQHLQGVIEHGQEFVIYRSFDNVRKDSALAIHCMLSQIERRMQRDMDLRRRFPDTFYMQMDGGSENYNKTTLAILSLLVACGIFKTVIVSRMSRGHGHLDNDQKYGVVTRTTRKKLINTPQEYKRYLEKGLRRGGSDFSVVDIPIVPNYEHIMDGCIDSEFKLLKKEHTQLVWKFQAVARSERYKLGVKTNYRAYYQDEVFEIRKTATTGLLDLGVGLEPILTSVQWFPEEDAPAIHILTDIPTKNIIPCGFKLGSFEKREKTCTKYREAYPNRKDKIAEWNEFVASFPNSDSVNEYFQKGGVLHVPLRDRLFPFCNVDNSTIIEPVVSKKRTFDGEPIKECKTTRNVPHSGDPKRKKPREFLDPSHEGSSAILTEAQREDFIRTLSTLTRKKINKKQLMLLLKDAKLKLSGNMDDQISRLQSFYGITKEESSKEGKH